MDYDKIGLKAGLEIHQQLDTKKLFCNCPSVLRSDNPDFEVMRKLHAIAGETGGVDEAVRHEAQKDKRFIYQGYHDTNCLVELDEAPPEAINKDALKIALQVTVLLNADILPVTQIMRKTVIDGSNTGGFQRTVLIANNGYFDTSYGRVRVATIALEEDAARIIEQKEDKTIYRLDRLGIPLIEISTEADIKNPQQAKEAALYLGDILRACRVKRGIGTIRQDVNISIAGHPRVEIKGFQDVKMFVKTIEIEIERQARDIKDKKLKSEVRKANADGTTSFMRPMPGAARMYPETDLELLYVLRELVNDAKKELPKLRADIRDELKAHGLNEEMAKLVISEGKLEEFKEMLQIYNDANLIAKILILWPKEISKKENISVEKINERINLDVIESILQALNKNRIEKHDIQRILEKIAKGEEAGSAINSGKEDTNKLEEEIIKIIKEKPGLTVNGYMGLVMAKLKGRISGKQAGDILKKHVKD